MVSPNTLSMFLVFIMYHSSIQSGLAWSTFHVQTLGLIPKYFIPDRWSLRLKPVTDIEREKERASVRSDLGRSLDKSLFRKEADDIVLDLCKNLLGYCQQLTDSNGERTIAVIGFRVLTQSFCLSLSSAIKIIKPVFVWTLSSTKDGEGGPGELREMMLRSSKGIVFTNCYGIPMVCFSLVPLLFRCIYHPVFGDARHLPAELREYDNPEAKRAQGSIVSSSSDDLYGELSLSQRQQLALRELQKMLVDKTREINNALYIIENALLLQWRHLDFYLNRYNASTSSPSFDDDYSRSSTADMDYGGRSSIAKGKGSQPPIADVDVLKQDSSIVLQPILNKLAPVELTQETAGINYRSRNSYIQIYTVGLVFDSFTTVMEPGGCDVVCLEANMGFIYNFGFHFRKNEIDDDNDACDPGNITA
ncbi:hypothetical protein BC938DRAFT_473531 [Jimgerdemannia flammicorona]|uniref:Uncharacterized protein n=1 Tax=Jimgerdemannia flammicorona TaxID=994334 RepID=A0A433QT84_9FUNG|nr:hypothetical protein BC938DRAFT_473531 [Jimgerdemannia flammicorona]